MEIFRERNLSSQDMKGEACKIFYTDDDVDDRDIFKEAAREVSNSLQVVTQGNGDELINLLKKFASFSEYYFLDLNMPIKNGYEVLKEIKQSEQIKNLPVIIFSTSDDEKSIVTSRQLGANLYIPKPASFSLLKKAISYTLSINWDTFSASEEDFVYRVN